MRARRVGEPSPGPWFGPGSAALMSLVWLLLVTVVALTPTVTGSAATTVAGDTTTSLHALSGAASSPATSGRLAADAMTAVPRIDSPPAFAAEAGTAAVRTHRHHTVPAEILRQLPDDVANHPMVRGRAGAPNRWAIPEDVHKGIHSGPGGGAYNQAWKDSLDSLGRSPTVDDVLRFREQITKQFGIDVYRPY